MSNYNIPPEVSANPNLVDFPTDDGICADLQKIGLLTAARIHDEDQLDRLLCVYGILVRHTKAAALRNFADRATAIAQTMFEQAARDKAVLDAETERKGRELREAQARVALLLGQDAPEKAQDDSKQEG